VVNIEPSMLIHLLGNCYRMQTNYDLFLRVPQYSCTNKGGISIWALLSISESESYMFLHLLYQHGYTRIFIVFLAGRHLCFNGAAHAQTRHPTRMFHHTSRSSTPIDFTCVQYTECIHTQSDIYGHQKQKFWTIGFRFAPLHRMCDAMAFASCTAHTFIGVASLSWTL
jgi:hypothetical protein